MAQAIIEGNLGADPQLRTTQDGKPWATFSIAWSERVKDKAGSWVDGPTVWVNVRCYGAVAESVCETARKGQRLIVAGDMHMETWASDRGEQDTMVMSARHVGASFAFQRVDVSRRDRGGVSHGGFSSGGSFGAGDDQPPF